jgi:adenine deaminase
MTPSELIRYSKGEMPCDLLLSNARIVNVFSGEILSGDIAMAGGLIVGIGKYQAEVVEDLGGRFVAPGFIDAHVHIESSMTCVPEFIRAVLPHGTTTVVADPHEIANVLGMTGIRYMLDSADDLPANVYFSLPSCVPATDMETSGARLSASDLKALAGDERIMALGEMMNYPGVISGDPDVLEKLIMMRSFKKPMDGHAPMLSGFGLNAYLSAGISSDHECATLDEAKEKLRDGMHIMIREGTGAKNLDALLPLVNEMNSRRIMWCTDDRHPHDLLERGSIDDIVRRSIQAGLDPVIAIRMATINPAEYFGLNHLGAIAPGRKADLIVFSDLSDPVIETVYCTGRKTAEKGVVLPGMILSSKVETPDAMHVDVSRVDFSIPAEMDCIRIIEIIPDQLITREKITEGSKRNNEIVSDPARDILKIAVVERHKGTGNIGKGFVTGLGLKQGAIASSVAHDSHNIIVAGATDTDMITALRRVVDLKGGLVVACNGQIIAELALPVAGLMSPEPMWSVRLKITSLIDACRHLGSNLDDPFMTLSFLALPVIPALKITDKGLVNVDEFKIVPLFAG